MDYVVYFKKDAKFLVFNFKVHCLKYLSTFNVPIFFLDSLSYVVEFTHVVQGIDKMIGQQHLATFMDCIKKVFNDEELSVSATVKGDDKVSCADFQIKRYDLCFQFIEYRQFGIDMII